MHACMHSRITLVPSPHPLPAQARAWFGIPSRPEATALDGFNQIAASLFFCYALWIGLTGRKV